MDRARAIPNLLARKYATEIPITPDCERHQPAEHFAVAKLLLSIVLTVATVGAFVSAAIYAHYAHRQIAESQRLARNAHDQVVQAFNANIIAKDAVNRADLRAKEANQIARDTLTNTERPWIGPSSANFTEKATAGRPIKISVTVTNSGKSPALHVFERLAFKPWAYPIDDLKMPPFLMDPILGPCMKGIPKWTDDLGGGILLPGASTGPLEYKSPALGDALIKLLNEPAMPEPIPNAEMASIGHSDTKSSGKIVFGLFMAGCIDYFDEFGKRHRTYVCSMYSPSETGQNGALLANCLKGNSAD
jgi:hypothetical protein